MGWWVCEDDTPERWREHYNWRALVAFAACAAFAVAFTGSRQDYFLSDCS